MFDAFQTAEQQCLTHTVQVCTQRVHQHNAMRSRISSQFIVISGTSQRIVQNLIEARTAKLFRDQILQLVTTVGSCLVAQIRFYIFTELYIIISVDTENIFNDIDITLYVDTVNRNMDSQTFFSL